MNGFGMEKPESSDLPVIRDRISFLYAERCKINRADITIPLAFEVAAECSEKDDIGAIMRRKTRDKIAGGHILERCVKDLHRLLEIESEIPETDVLNLWDGSNGYVEAHKSW
jgi:CRISPR-associated protein Cas1